MKLDNIPEVRISGLVADLAGFTATNNLPTININRARIKKLETFFEWAIEAESNRRPNHQASKHQLRFNWTRHSSAPCYAYATSTCWSYTGEVASLKLDQFSRDFAMGANSLGLRVYHGYRYISFRWNLK